MYHKQLVIHVTKKIRDGIPNDDIKKELENDGWTADDIKEAFFYSSYPNKIKGFSPIRTLHSEVPSYISALFLTLAICIFAASIYFYNKNITLSYTINLPTVSEPGKTALTYGEQPALSNPDFFAKVKKEFIADKADFVEADLSTMILRVYKEGELSLEVPINSKGHEGSWWETPAGLYKISNKEKAHFSGMGHVWMPWSMNFQGNFYIHGRTYYPDGTLTSKTYTGGCIRLDTESAKKVYDAVDNGTPLLVFEHSFTPDAFTYTDAVPSLSASIYLSADIRNNHVFVKKESTKKVPIASITKLVTALVTTEYINLDNTATVPKEAIIYTSKARLAVGSQYTIYQLLFPLLMESSNEAAETIARYYGREKFIQHMNEKAKAIGMLDTTFSDPSGAGEGNVSTAEDLFMLAKYIYNNRSFIFNITSGKVKNSAYGSSGFSNLGNFNDFIDNQYFYGGKNGKSSSAEETNLSVFEFPTSQSTRPVVTIILQSPNEKNDAEALLDFTLNHFR